MATITDSLIAEHRVLSNFFAAIERLLPEVQTVNEVRMLVRLVEGVLSGHADVEQNLAYAALDQALAEKGQLDRLHQDHQEIDARFHQARKATDFSEAVRLLKTGLDASRDHFVWEEQTVFPLFEKAFGAATLEALGAAAANRPVATMPEALKPASVPITSFMPSGWSARVKF